MPAQLNSIPRRAAGYLPYLAAALAGLAVVLGTFGFRTLPSSGAAMRWDDALYRSLALFVMLSSRKRCGVRWFLVLMALSDLALKDAMSTETQPEVRNSRRILVAGDVCLDVVGVPIPAKSADPSTENWRLTGETRTHFLPGGALLLAKFIRAPRLVKPLADAEQEAQRQIREKQLKGDAARELRFRVRDEARSKFTRPAEDDVIGPRPKPPNELSGASRDPLYQDGFIAIAERLTRDEIVHSLLELKLFSKTVAPDEENSVLRVESEHGFSGPVEPSQDPSLEVVYPEPKDPPQIIVLDDTGNRFRKNTPGNPWPKSIEGGQASQPDAANPPLIVYKLHRPLPSASGENSLWEKVKTGHPHNRVVIVSVDDLRSAGAPISTGLSWERTALEVVWQLKHFAAFSELSDCPRLIVRLGLDGAVLWEFSKENKDRPCRAWLIYDPVSIEGSFAGTAPGTMVACGSAFTAALVHRLAAADDAAFSPLLKPPKPEPNEEPPNEELLLGAIEAGLHASRRLLQLGFGDYLARPNYPGPEVFDQEGTGSFHAHLIPMIPGALEPDRSYWRLLDSTFSGAPKLRDTAVVVTATKQKEGANEDEAAALRALKRAPMASYGELRTHDRAEIENYRALDTLLRDYLCARTTPRPLSIAVFGPPGAGKSFGVNEVAKSLQGQRGCKDVEPLTFNLSLYQTPEELSGAFHLVRDVSLRGKVPLVFFDEFDTRLGEQDLGWLRYFLSPMQDGEFLDRGAPHPVGQAIFVFAGGTCACYEEFQRHPQVDDATFRTAKGPDFLSRLRATLDIPSLNFLVAHGPSPQEADESRLPGTFNPYGPVSSFPCETAILLRRANILAFNLPKMAAQLVRANGSLNVAPEVLRVLLHLPRFEYGNRSFEALLEMSHLSGAESFTPALLPSPFQVPLHANANYLWQLIGTEFPLPEPDRLAIARAIHNRYQQQKRTDPDHDSASPSLRDWDELPDEYRESNLEQADDIANKLRSANLWIRKSPDGASQAARDSGRALLEPHVETLAQAEHDRWAAEKRQAGWAPGRDTAKESRIDALLLQNCLFPWERLTEEQKELDREAIRNLPDLLAGIGYEIVRD